MSPPVPVGGDPQMQTYIDSVAALIAREGWAVQGVGADKPGAQFHYTVGFAGRHLPELWVAGLPYDIGGRVLNAVGQQQIIDGPVTAGLVVDLGPAPSVRIRGPIDAKDAEANVARMFNDAAWPAVMQVCWADPAGLYPDDEGYDHATFPQRLVRLRRPVGRHLVNQEAVSGSLDLTPTGAADGLPPSYGASMNDGAPEQD